MDSKGKKGTQQRLYSQVHLLDPLSRKHRQGCRHLIVSIKLRTIGKDQGNSSTEHSFCKRHLTLLSICIFILFIPSFQKENKAACKTTHRMRGTLYTIGNEDEARSQGYILCTSPSLPASSGLLTQLGNFYQPMKDHSMWFQWPKGKSKRSVALKHRTILGTKTPGRVGEGGFKMAEE